MPDGLLMKYFVLKPGGDDQYASASRAAMLTYAKLIEFENKALADELIAWAHDAGLKASASHKPRIE